MQGRWNEFFKNSNPIVLELACGKAEYTVGLARLNAEKNFIGVDIKGNRLWVGAKECLDKKINNAAFLRTQIDKIDSYFLEDEISEIWITFPDPQLRKSKAKKRLTHPKFLRLYDQILKPGGYIHLKTDSPDLYYFTKFVIKKYGLTTFSDKPDLYGSNNLPPELTIKTYYENLNIAGNNKVFYLCFTLPDNLSGDDAFFNKFLKDEELNINDTGVN